jgi:rod shape-determining protein MreC
MLDFIKTWKFLGLIVLLIALLLLARGCGNSDTLSDAESTAKETWAPISAVGDFFSNIFDFSTKKGLQTEIDALNEELATLKTESQISVDVASENEELRALLELKEAHASAWVTVAAEVTARDADNWYEKLTINKGSADGITENMAVVNQDGLLGKTINVTENTSDVLLIIDASGSLGGMLQESSIEGVLQGIGGGKGLINMTKLPYNADIQLNDVVVSSGVGGVFPAGLLVGNVIKVNTSSDGLSKEAIVEPYCDLDDIKFVLVIRPMTDAEASAAADSSAVEDNADNSGEDTSE